MRVGRVVWVDSTRVPEKGLVARVSLRMEDGSRKDCLFDGVKPWGYVLEDENLPERDWIEEIEYGYESIFDEPLKKVTTNYPEKINSRNDNDTLADYVKKHYEADVPFYRKLSVIDGISGYIQIPDKPDDSAFGFPVYDFDSVDTDIDYDGEINPRIMLADIEVRVSDDETFRETRENATQPINVICSYDNYEDEYTVFFFNKFDNLDNPKRIREIVEEKWDGDSKYSEADIELRSSPTEVDMLNEFINYILDRGFDLTSGWNWVDFDYEYIITRLERLADQGTSQCSVCSQEPIYNEEKEQWYCPEHGYQSLIEDSERISPFGNVSYTSNDQMQIRGLPAFDMMEAFCFSGDTEVLTPDGIRNIKEIEVGDKVYTLNEDTHEVEVKPVTDTHITENKWGTLESHSGRSHDFKVTPNHRFYVSEDTRKKRKELSPDDYSYREYRELSSQARPYKFPEHEPSGGEKRKTFDLVEEVDSPVVAISNKNGRNLRKSLNDEENMAVNLTHGTATRVSEEYDERVGKYIIPNKVYEDNRDIIDDYADDLYLKSDTQASPVPTDFDMDNFLRLMGWYISEGYVDCNSQLAICQNKSKHRESIEALLDEMDVDYYSNEDQYVINGQVLGEWFLDNCGGDSYEKNIPEWVFNLHWKHLDCLLETLVDGDGTRNSEKSLAYSTVSTKLKKGIVKIGLLCGWKPRVRKHSQHDHVYEIYLSRQGGSFKKENGKSIDHEDTVYCITAKDNHTIMAGRNGKFSWIGQCDKMTFTNWRSTALDYVCREELDVGKVDDVDINKDWERNPEKLIAYNIVDVGLTVALDDANDIHNFFYDMGDVSSIPIYDAFYEKRLVDGYVMSRRGEDEILPSADESELVENAGGYVDDPVNGRNENVGVADLKSLYPSAMITWNISTETVSPNPDEFENYVKLPKVPEPKDVEGNIHEDQIDWDWLYCSLDKEGLIPRTLKKLFKKRDREKSRMYEADPDSAEYDKWDRKQGATKVVMNCFTGDTELVTPDGVRNIKDIEPGEKVYSIDPDSYDVEIKTVIDTTKEDNLYGEVEHIATDRMNQKITKNHKILTEENGLIEYQNLDCGEHSVPNHNPVKSGREPDFFDVVEEGWIDEGRIWLDYKEHGRTFKQKLPDEVSENIVNSKNRGEYRLDDLDIYREYSVEIRSVSENVRIQHDDKHGSVPVVYNSESFIELIGWFITEGNCYSDNRTNSKTIQIAQKTQPGINKIKRCLRECGLSFNLDVNGFVVGSTPIYNMMEKLCGDGSYNKCIPEFIFDLNYELRDILWDALMLGDGDEIGNFQRYSTASDELKDGVCRLLVLQGWQPQVRRDSGVWRIQKSDGTKFSTNRTSTETHEDKVYCITLEDNHTVLAGRNGKFSWIGQSFYGNASSKYWRLSNQYLGDAVTSSARYTLWKGRISIENMGYEAIYGDTDSHFLKLKEDDLESRVEELKRVASKMDEDASSIAEDIGLDEKHPFLKNDDLHGDDYTCMVWEPEKIYKVWMQLGKKKRYAGNVDWKEGTYYDSPKISISGFEYRRSDSMGITAELQKKVIRKILTGKSFEDVSEYIQSIISQIDKNNENIRNFALPGSINKALHKYPNREVPRAAEYSNQHLGYEFGEGDDPFVYYVKDVPAGLPQTDVVALQWNEDIPDGFVLDKESIIERGIKKPIDPIIDEMDWKFEEIRTGKKQKTMQIGSAGGNPFA